MSEVEKTPQKEPEKNAARILQEELIKEATGEGAKSSSRLGGILQILAIPFLAIFTGLVLGAIIIVLTSPEFYAGWRQSPLQGLAEGWRIVATSYSALFTGAFGDPARIIASLQSGDAAEICLHYLRLRPLDEVADVPYEYG